MRTFLSRHWNWMVPIPGAGARKRKWTRYGFGSAEVCRITRFCVAALHIGGAQKKASFCDKRCVSKQLAVCG